MGVHGYGRFDNQDHARPYPTGRRQPLQQLCGLELIKARRFAEAQASVSSRAVNALRQGPRASWVRLSSWAVVAAQRPPVVLLSWLRALSSGPGLQSSLSSRFFAEKLRRRSSSAPAGLVPCLREAVAVPLTGGLARGRRAGCLGARRPSVWRSPCAVPGPVLGEIRRCSCPSKRLSRAVLEPENRAVDGAIEGK